MRILFAAAVVLVAYVPHASFADVTKDGQLGTYIAIHGFNFRLNTIQSAAKVTDNAAVPDDFSRTQHPENGYLVISGDIQNASASETARLENPMITVWLEDGSRIEYNAVVGPLVGARFQEAPQDLPAKEHLNVTYFVANWPGTKVTKIFFAIFNTNVRYEIKPSDVTPLPGTGPPGSAPKG